MKNRNSCYSSSSGSVGIEQEHVKPEFSLPSLLPGSEYEFYDPNHNRYANLLGLAIAIVVHAQEGEVPESQRHAWFDLWEEERKKVNQYWKKCSEFNYRHDPGSYSFSVSDTVRENPYILFIREWLKKSLFTIPDWDRLYSLIASQLNPSERHHSEWWVKLRDICRRAQTSIEPFDAIAEIRNVSEEYRTEQKTDTTPIEKEKEKVETIGNVNIDSFTGILGNVQAENLQIGDNACIDKQSVPEKPAGTH